MPTLQELINTATPGATISLPDGSEHVGNFVINKPLTITANPANRARLVSAPPAVGANPEPVVTIPPGVNDVTLRGLEITSTVPKLFDLVRIGTWQTTDLALVPRNITIDQCLIHGHTTQEVQRGVAANGANVTISKSRIYEIHGVGYDTQAVAIWNGPGPLKILDCYLEAAGENFMAGGSDPRIPNLIPSDIEIRRCHLFKPLSWEVGDPAYKGIHWSVKNLLEVKMGRRVVIDGNVLENSWGDAQIGYAVLFTVRNQDGGAPWAVIEDVEFTNNVVRNSEQGMQLLGSDNLKPSQQSSRLKIVNNRFENIAHWGFVVNAYHDVTIEHNTHRQGHNIFTFQGQPSERFTYRNNATIRNPAGFGIKGDGVEEGLPTLARYAPGAVVEGNVIAMSSTLVRFYPPNNHYPTDLSGLSALKGTDGLVPGYRGTVEEPPPPPPSPPPSPDGTKAVTITDTTGGVWTIGPLLQTLRNNVHMGGGSGTIYKWLGGVVYVLGTNAFWYKWVGSWQSVSQQEPGTQPTTRILPWPKQQGQQNSLLDSQWASGRYRLKRIDGNTGTFEKVL